MSVQATVVLWIEDERISGMHFDSAQQVFVSLNKLLHHSRQEHWSSCS